MEKQPSTLRKAGQSIVAVIGAGIITSALGLFVFSDLIQQLMSGTAKNLFKFSEEMAAKISKGIVVAALAIIFIGIAYTIYKGLNPKVKFNKITSDPINQTVYPKVS